MGETVELTIGVLTVGASSASIWFSTKNVHQRLAAAMAALKEKAAGSFS